MAGRHAKWMMLVGAAGTTLALLSATNPTTSIRSSRRASMTTVRPLKPVVPGGTAVAIDPVVTEVRAESEEDRAREAVKIAESIDPPDHPEVASALYNASGTLCERGFSDEALTLIARALVLLEKGFGIESLEVAQALEREAAIRGYRHENALAEPLVRRALAIRDKVMAAPDLKTASDLKDLVLFCRDQGRYAEAEPMARRMVAIVEQLDRPAGNPLVLCLYFLDNIEFKLGHPDEAVATLKRALTIFETNPEVEASGKLVFFQSLAEIATARGRTEDAIALSLQSNRILAQFNPMDLSNLKPETRSEAGSPLRGNFPELPKDIGLRKTSGIAGDSVLGLPRRQGIYPDGRRIRDAVSPRNGFVLEKPILDRSPGLCSRLATRCAPRTTNTEHAL